MQFGGIGAAVGRYPKQDLYKSCLSIGYGRRQLEHEPGRIKHGVNGLENNSSSLSRARRCKLVVEMIHAVPPADRLNIPAEPAS
jgi:hypothetical protein